MASTMDGRAGDLIDGCPCACRRDVSRRRTQALSEASAKAKKAGGKERDVGPGTRSIVDEHAAFDRAFSVDRVAARAEVRVLACG